MPDEILSGKCITVHSNRTVSLSEAPGRWKFVHQFHYREKRNRFSSRRNCSCWIYAQKSGQRSTFSILFLFIFHRRPKRMLKFLQNELLLHRKCTFLFLVTWHWTWSDDVMNWTIFPTSFQGFFLYLEVETEDPGNKTVYLHPVGFVQIRFNSSIHVQGYSKLISPSNGMDQKIL